MAQTTKTTTTTTYHGVEVIVLSQDITTRTAQIIPVTLQDNAAMEATVDASELLIENRIS